MKTQFSPPVMYHSHLCEILLKSVGALPLTFSASGVASLFCQTFFLSLQCLAGAALAQAVAHKNHCHPVGLFKYSTTFCGGIVTPDSCV